MDEFQLELENRIKNLMWTVSGDYGLEFKPDLQAFTRSKYIALYDGIKQGAFAKYFDREAYSLYLVKKIYLHAMEAPLMSLAQLCIEFAVSGKIIKEREGVASIRKKACEDVLEKDFHRLQENGAGRLKISLFREVLRGHEPAPARQRKWMDMAESLDKAENTMDIIKVTDQL